VTEDHQERYEECDASIQVPGTEQTMPISYLHIDCHMIFDVKMDFTWKVWFVPWGHMTVTPVSMTNSPVVSQQSVKIAFIKAELHNLKILVADFGNAYLNADCHDKVYTIAGLEFWSNSGKCVFIT
jgi:hypothetical protein